MKYVLTMEVSFPADSDREAERMENEITEAVIERINSLVSPKPFSVLKDRQQSP